VREIRTLRLTRRGLETEPWDGLRHRQRAKAAGKQRLPIPNVTAPVFDPTLGGWGMVTYPGYPALSGAAEAWRSATAWKGETTLKKDEYWRDD
jgi:hypothetical protein